MKSFQLLRNIATATAVVLATVAPRAALGGTFSDDFSAGLSPSFWSVWQTTAGLYSVDATNGHVQVAKTSAHSPGGFQNVAIALNLAALAGTNTGDFSTQVDFTNATVPGPGLDQVELHTYFQDGSYFFTVYDNYNGLNVHVWNGGLLGRTPVTGNSGTFRISRVGPTLTGYYNGAPIHSEIKDSPLVRIDFALQNNNGSDDPTSVTFDNFSLTAAFVAPRLSISLLGGMQVQLSWATNSVGYALESATSLPDPAWTVVPNVPAVTNGQFTVTVGAGEGQRFFRLHEQ
jgi:hypothetical protein